MVEGQIEAEVELYQGRYVTETPPFSNQQIDDDDEVDHYRDADANGKLNSLWTAFRKN